MASASSLPCEEQLLCSICLDVFSEPVSTPCGHNYCKTCITDYWATRDQTQCPLCKKKFRKKPQLQVNTEFRDMVELFNSLKMNGDDDLIAKPGEVRCDVCLGPKVNKAQKTCLVCLASYCQPHLELTHQRVTSLKKHKLIDPVSNLEDRVCKVHDKMFELFCQVDHMCICLMCLRDNHAAHAAIPLERAFNERKPQLDSTLLKIKIAENAKWKRIKEIKHSLEWRKKESEKEIADIAEVFTAVVTSLQKSQARLIELIQDQQKVAEKQAEDHVTQLEQEVTELMSMKSQTEQLLQTDDHVRLLQSWPPPFFLPHTGDPYDPLSLSSPLQTPDFSDFGQQSYLGMVKKAVAQMEKMLGNEMEMLIHEVRLSDGCKQPGAPEKLMSDEFIKEVWNLPQDKLMMIQQNDAVDVSLAAHTANPRLMVSEDGKQLRVCENPLFFPASYGTRFEHLPFVLGTDGFSSGRFYYEVQVSGCKNWILGVVKESANRDTFFLPSLETGWWTLCTSDTQSQFQQEYFGDMRCPPLYLNQNPQTVGVFVDYENGEVSFYNVETRTPILSYTGCSFTETGPALVDFLLSLTGTPSSHRQKLYPVFGMSADDSNDLLVITPVVPRI